MPIPERLGKVLVRREIGRGAMGVVYEAYDPMIERTVAVKVLHLEDPDPRLSAELRERFRREAQAAGRLGHPNIVAVHEYGEEPAGGQAYIVMEFVRGRDLRRLLDEGTRFTPQQTGRLMAQLLAALAHAHAQGVVHRDIKPGNIIVLDDGQVKVGDFGIAKLDTSELTQLGAVLGTISHMSPEQLAGQPVDARSDLFSCGVVLYQLLTGKLPFSGPPATVMRQVLHDDPPAPSTQVRTLNPALDVVVARALAKRPDQRFASAAEFASALQAALAADTEPTIVLARDVAVPIARRPGLTARSLGAVMALAAGGGLAWWYAARDDAAPAPQAQRTPSVASAPATALAVVASAAAVSAAAAPPASSTSSTPPAPLPPRVEDVERLAWEDALKADRVAAYEAYLREYPRGRYAARARVRIAAAPSSAPVAQAASVPMAAPAAPRAQAQAQAQATREPAKGVRAAPVPAPAPAPAERTPAAAGPSSAPRDLKVACSDASSQNLAKCQFALGERHRLGRDVARNAAVASQWYRKAAMQGHAAAQYELGSLLEHGQGVGKDVASAVSWYRKAAEQGHAHAQNRLGLAYENGTAGAPNRVLAVEWFRKAAEQGLPLAQTNLGRMYLHGRGVFKSTELALQWLRRAAEQGEGNAKFHLAQMHEQGDGLPPDRGLAMRLYREAIANPSLHPRNRAVAQARLSATP